MLVAMRPHDPRYAAIALPAGSPAHDASVRCVMMSWPVINPLSRYRHAKRAQAGANPPEWPKSIIARQDAYWRSEANMAEGNPMLALERGEKVLTPPAVWYQGHGDMMHDYKDAESDFPGNEPQRFVAAYRKAGGDIALEYIDMERHAGHSPDLSKSGRHVRAHGGVRLKARFGGGGGGAQGAWSLCVSDVANRQTPKEGTPPGRRKGGRSRRPKRSRKGGRAGGRQEKRGAARKRRAAAKKALATRKPKAAVAPHEARSDTDHGTRRAHRNRAHQPP